MSGRPYKLLYGSDSATGGLDLGGSYGSAEKALAKAEESLRGIVKYGLGFQARAVVTGPDGYVKRVRLQLKAGVAMGKPTHDPANWDLVEHEPLLTMTEHHADGRSTPVVEL